MVIKWLPKPPKHQLHISGSKKKRKEQKQYTLPGEPAIFKEAHPVVSGCISVATFRFSREARDSYFVSLVTFPPQQHKDSEGK